MYNEVDLLPDIKTSLHSLSSKMGEDILARFLWFWRKKLHFGPWKVIYLWQIATFSLKTMELKPFLKG